MKTLNLREGFPYRVQFSEKGLTWLRRYTKDHAKNQLIGTAIRKDKKGNILVLWDDRKTPIFYHPDFITNTNHRQPGVRKAGEENTKGMKDKKFIKSITPNRGRVGGQDVHNYYGMECPHCGAQTNVDPALVKDDDPMLYCKECDKPLFGEPE